MDLIKDMMSADDFERPFIYKFWLKKCRDAKERGAEGFTNRKEVDRVVIDVLGALINRDIGLSWENEEED